MDVRTTLKNGITQLRDAQVPSYTLAAELLLLHALGRDRTWLYAHPEDEVAQGDAERFFALTARRAAGEPTQYLTGKQEFWGFEFAVTPDVLIPRPETEHVMEVALDRLALRELRSGRQQNTKGQGLRIADVGTGSGCLAIALAKELPEAAIYATDISAAALEIARRNAERHRVADRIEFAHANLFKLCSVVGAQRRPEPEQKNAAHHPARMSEGAKENLHNSRTAAHDSWTFDLIVSNPPYIGRREAASLPREVREHEPEAALYGGEEGYEIYAELIAQAAQHVKPGAVLVLELGQGRLTAVRPLLDTTVWTKVSVTNDLAGIPRVIAAEKT
jgi:release factor glutamine methyltransferase